MKILKYLKAIWWILKYGPEAVSIHDPLTGLLNRGVFDELLLREISWAERYNEPFCLALVDLDGLKLINDNFGHKEGDKAIQTIAGILEKSCRTSDFVGKYGGDEFLVCFPKAGEKEIKKIESRFQNEISKTNFSFSFGFSVWRAGKNLERMKEEADTEMYWQKALKK